MKSNLDETINYYNENGLEYYKNTVGVKMDHLYEPFLALLPGGSRILDAGCGSGRDSLYFINRGYMVTAMDASQTMVKLCQELTGQACLNLTFHDMDFQEEFNGIWACATLLHLPRTDINNVISKLMKALKINGTIYASFKYGNKEEFRNGRIFNYYNEDTINEVLNKHKELELIKTWVTEDVRPGRSTEKWLNVLVKRVS